ncbi:MAG: hypothetical protein OXF93_02930 [Acidobacteria bacterium]|nr:hypothetical protein [Acidobacteriota bacterium]
MLLRMAVLERIVRGEISLVFRRWRRPTVRTGGSLRTAVGVLRILDVAVVDEADVSDTDATAAGYASRAALLADLDARAGRPAAGRLEGRALYRVAVAFGGADPRVALREQDALSDADVEELLRRIRRLDAGAAAGPWTRRVLEVIEAQPGAVSSALAERLGCERGWLKPQVRKLKNLGLTISLRVGYELSPRGRIVLEHLRGGDAE